LVIKPLEEIILPERSKLFKSHWSNQWLTIFSHTLYVGAAKDARLIVARVDATGKLSQVAIVPTH